METISLLCDDVADTIIESSLVECRSCNASNVTDLISPSRNVEPRLPDAILSAVAVLKLLIANERRFPLINTTRG
jgi:hypothetical protein